MDLSRQLVVLLGLAFLVTQAVVACDPPILTDFGRVNATSGEDFKDTSFELENLPLLSDSEIELVPGYPGANNGLTGLGLASLFFIAGPGGEVPPHYHTRGSEIFFVLTGSWTVGFIDSNKKLYTTTLVAGDQYVFPIGLIHYQVAIDTPATGYSVFNSNSPGLFLVFPTLFSTSPTIPDKTLATAAKVSVSTIEILKKAMP